MFLDSRNTLARNTPGLTGWKPVPLANLTFDQMKNPENGRILLFSLLVLYLFGYWLGNDWMAYIGALGVIYLFSFGWPKGED